VLACWCHRQQQPTQTGTGAVSEGPGVTSLVTFNQLPIPRLYAIINATFEVHKWSVAWNVQAELPAHPL
jgi:hypothetical protein